MNRIEIMPRYFMEVAYMGTNYAGFQVQQNANTVQAELEKALQVYFKTAISLTGSSRTDAGVHALQNYFHFDFPFFDEQVWLKAVYHMNAILPNDIVIRQVREVRAEAHCRFDAISRSYEYLVYQYKDPFLQDRAFYYPYPLNVELLQKAAVMIQGTHDFEAFAKRNSQVHTFMCTIFESRWNLANGHSLVYQVRGNRFLRGMVRGLVGTMLRVGAEKISISEFAAIIEAKDARRVDFSVPPQGLSLIAVQF